jgi:hypothetical protein
MLKKILDYLKGDFHIPIAITIFTATSIFHFWTHLDLGPQYTNSLYALYAFLGGHAYVSRNQYDNNQDSR